MSTEDLDGRLRAAGERWRAANTAVADVDFGQLAIAAEPVDVPLTPTPDVAPRPRRMRVLLAAGVGVAAAVAATMVAVSLGGSTPAPHRAIGTAASALVGVDWRLAQITGRQGTPLAVSAALMIDGKGQLSGTDGCNHLSAHVTFKADTINLGAVASTEVGCLNPSAAFGAQVALLDAVLSGTVQWSVQGEELTLSKNGAAELIYRAAPPATTDPKALVGVEWQLTVIAGPGPDGTAAKPVAPASLLFDGRGEVSGTDGCNAFSGPVTINAGRLDVGDLRVTLIGCTGTTRNDESSAIDAILGRNVVWSIKDGQLALTKTGVGSLSYHQTPPSTRPNQATSSIPASH